MMARDKQRTNNEPVIFSVNADSNVLKFKMLRAHYKWLRII